MLYYVLFCRRFGLAARETAHNRKPLFAKLYAELGYEPRCVDFPFLLLHNYRPAGTPRAPQPLRRNKQQQQQQQAQQAQQAAAQASPQQSPGGGSSEPIEQFACVSGVARGR